MTKDKKYEWGFDLCSVKMNSFKNLCDDYGLKVTEDLRRLRVIFMSANIKLECTTNPFTGKSLNKFGSSDEDQNQIGYMGYVGITVTGDAELFIDFLEQFYACLDYVKGMGDGVSAFSRNFV